MQVKFLMVKTFPLLRSRPKLHTGLFLLGPMMLQGMCLFALNSAILDVLGVDRCISKESLCAHFASALVFAFLK